MPWAPPAMTDCRQIRLKFDDAGAWRLTGMGEKGSGWAVLNNDNRGCAKWVVQVYVKKQQEEDGIDIE